MSAFVARNKYPSIKFNLPNKVKGPLSGSDRTAASSGTPLTNDTNVENSGSPAAISTIVLQGVGEGGGVGSGGGIRTVSRL